ncbi:MAG: redox-regulated ATPase YchF [Planctomycetes bacterium]|nr:redox-regulated ATPase YchF [Planctomycetota bacterium]
MRVAFVGPPQSGKSDLFYAVAAAGGSHVDVSRSDQPHLAVVKVPDERVLWLAGKYKPPKTTLAELEFVDLPGLDLSEQEGRERAKTHWPAMRQADMLAFVVRSFADPSVAPYRKRVDAQADLDELLTEMIFADLDQVTVRIDKLNAALKKPTGKKEEQVRELDMMERLKAALESDKPVSTAVASDAEGKLLRSFAFLSQKPAIAVVNCDESQAAGGGDEQMKPLPCIRLSAKIEREIADLPAADRPAFLADLGLAAPARDRLIRACYGRMKLVSFLTCGEDECRAWTIPSGADAVTAAAEIHSDIARGFIRAETVSFEDLKAGGDMKCAKAAGKIRLEGKTYVVRDGDVINFRFNV